MPKKREKHHEIDLNKVNKILVKQILILRKYHNGIYQILAKKYYNSTNISLEKIRHLFCKYDNAKSRGKNALEEDKVSYYCSDEDIIK